MRRQDFIKHKKKIPDKLYCIRQAHLNNTTIYAVRHRITVYEFSQAKNRNDMINEILNKCASSILLEIKNSYIKGTVFQYIKGIEFTSTDNPESASIDIILIVHGKWEVPDPNQQHQLEELESIQVCTSKFQSRLFTRLS